MSPIDPPPDSFHPSDLSEWRAWFETNHATSPGVWLITWRKESGNTPLPYEETVCEALCWGWVDSLAKKLDEHRTMLRFTPRRPKSNWTKFNKQRVERLIAEGRMMPAGLAEVEAAKADGRWTLLDEADALIVPTDLADALAALPGARANFDAFTASERRAMLVDIATAKTPATRAKRVHQFADRAHRNERLPREI